MNVRLHIPCVVYKNSEDARLLNMPGCEQALYEFHILKEVRDRYTFDESLFSSNGNVIFANFHAARVFTQRLNEGRAPHSMLKAGHINAMGLIDEIFHVILRTYEERENPKVFARAVQRLTKSIGQGKFSTIVNTFSSLFPPIDTYRGKISIDQYLAGSTDGKSHLESTVEEIILLYFANINPAFASFKELFNDAQLVNGTEYKIFIAELERFFQTEKTAGPDQQYLFDLLKAPILASPDSLEGQLEFIRKRWGVLLSGKYLSRILGSEDFMKEESKMIVHDLGPPPLVVPTYPATGKGSSEPIEYERYSQDVEWMPRVVLLAKNTYVWLDQLSKKYSRAITTLDQIPDEELDQLARWNFTGLWLIGIWERSTASQKIKQMAGNSEAVSSAYSLYEYEIAGDLGGEAAFHSLSSRAWSRGIRLAGDMVPNHMGVSSKWMIEHPDYFIQSNYSPFPNYRFTGHNLSDHPTVHIRIEDRYWNKSDAAVVFQRVDTSNNDVRYIYHGNDGTHMPWNDTAQLNFLKAEVRDAVIQEIFHVAKKFPIIRFDAAMTLAKKHFQRLWYPQPGTGGDIPSRADHAMSRETFDQFFPNEFWREVVDRINRDMPGTLLLAEAFWMLEGFFVRTLGMHRVYNSAFMHMLMKEENAKYRELIKNTLAYDPEILKRYVNFMSNPDERTAVDQFGKDGKYFGVAILMVTLPGLPMFGHGQIEGFSEKYGMEYKRAYYNESPDEGLVHRHDREIFPVTSKRYLFSQVTNFEFYDVYGEHGDINENVFAYSNRTEQERALVFYHNKFADCRGWIKQTCSKAVPINGTADKQIRTQSIAQALGLKGDDRCFYLFREHRTNLEYIRSGKDLCENGWYVELKAFEYKLFMDFREIYDSTGDYSQLSASLHGNGVSNVEHSLKEMRLKPIHESIVSLIHQVSAFIGSAGKIDQLLLDNILTQYRNTEDKISPYRIKSPSQSASSVSSVVNFKDGLIASRKLYPHIMSKSGTDNGKESMMIAAYLTLRNLLAIPEKEKRILYDELQFSAVAGSIFPGNDNVSDQAGLIRVLVCQDGNPITGQLLIRLIDQPEVCEYLLVNTHEGITYYNRERFEELIRWMLLLEVIEHAPQDGSSSKELGALIAKTSMKIEQVQKLSLRASFQLDGLKKLMASEEF